MAVQNNTDYDVVSFAEVASIINHFTPEMISDAIEHAIASNKEMTFSKMPPNIPMALEANYKQQIANFPQFAADINNTKEGIYIYIINILCNKFNLQYTGGEFTDYYSAVYWMYEFLVSKFDSYLLNFLFQYTMQEKDTLFQTVSQRCQGEVSAYAKKMFKGRYSQFSLLFTNYECVLDLILQMDIDLPYLIGMSFGPQQKAFGEFLTSIIADKGDFFKCVYIPYIMNNKAFVITRIKSMLQGISGVGISDFSTGGI